MQVSDVKFQRLAGSRVGLFSSLDRTLRVKVHSLGHGGQKKTEGVLEEMKATQLYKMTEC